MALDPVCGMTVDPARAAGQVDHAGTTYYFCSKGCAAKFTADPGKYLSGVREAMPAPAILTIGGLKRHVGAEPAQHSGAAAASAAAAQSAPHIRPPAGSSRPPQPEPTVGHGAAVEWVCPMDPEVVSDRPGACPKCGMAL